VTLTDASNNAARWASHFWFEEMPRLTDLKVKLFTDGADKTQIVEMASIRG